MQVARAQTFVINNDSLRANFKKNEPHKVLAYYLQFMAKKIDYMSLYYDMEMKNYLLKWLDRNVIIDYEIDRFKSYLYGFNEDQKYAFTKSYIIRALKLDYDSIKMNVPSLGIYTGEAILELAKNKRIDMENSTNPLMIPNDVLYLHSKIAYPEAYKKIKQLWYENDKLIFRYNDILDGLFISLLMMNDQEAQSEFDKTIDKVIKTDGHMIVSTAYVENFEIIGNAYAVKKLIELLPVRKEVIVMSNSPTISIDFYVYDLLVQFIDRHNVKINSFSRNNLFNMSINERIIYMRNHHDDIVEASNQLIKKLEAEEKYWMENMPFRHHCR